MCHVYFLFILYWKIPQVCCCIVVSVAGMSYNNSKQLQMSGVSQYMDIYPTVIMTYMKTQQTHAYPQIHTCSIENAFHLFIRV